MTVATAAKVAVTAWQNRDSIKKVVVGVCVGFIMIFVLIIVCFMSLISAFIPEGKVDSNLNSENTAIYRSVSQVTVPFYQDIEDQMEQKKDDLIQENTQEVTVTDAQGNTQTKKSCDIKITRTVNYLGLGYLVAYLQCAGFLDKNTATINQEKAKEYLNQICSIKVDKISATEYQIYDQYLSTQEIADRYFTNVADNKMFLASCDAYADFFQTSTAKVKTDDIHIHDQLNTAFSLLQIPLYLQYSEPWASVAYGDGNIKEKGCCPTCLAMVLSYMKKEIILPSDVVSWAGNTYYVNGSGTGWSIFPAVGQHWDLNVENIGKNEEAMIQALSAKKPVIASVGPGTFTQGGHFIVLTGITEDGKIKVNDPNDNNTTKNFKDKEFDPSLIFRESKNFWSFEVK